MTDHKPLRICYVLKRYPRFSETFIVNEILALEAQGAQIQIIATKPPVEGVFHENLARIQAPVTYLPQPTHSPRKFLALLADALDLFGSQRIAELLEQDVIELEQGIRVAKLAATFDADIIHAHFATSAAAIARTAAQLTSKPYSITAHAKDIYHQDVDAGELKNKFDDAARIFTVSDYNFSYLSSTFPSSSSVVRRIYNGMPLNQLPMRGAHAPGCRIAAVGRLIEKKGFKYLLQAIAKLRSQFPAVHCDIVGDGPLSAELQILAQDLGIAEKVHFHGILPQHRVHELMLRADVLVAPCVVSQDGDRDGLPTVLLEAMAIGTSCISTPVTGIPEIILNRETGLLVPERDSDAISAACTELFSNMDLTKTLASAARTLIEANFDIHQNTAELLREWRNVAEQRKDYAA